MIVYIESLLALYSLYHPRFYFILFVALLYLLWYFDGSEYTGRRTWDLFRNARIWKRFNPCRYYFAGSNQKLTTYQRRLFILTPNATCLPMIWGFGLHAGQLDDRLDVCYVVPTILLKIPILRDVLLWTGAVAIREPSDLIELMNKNRSVCYCAAGMRDASNVHRWQLDPNASQLIYMPDDSLFEYCRQERVQLVPVLVANECVRYQFPYFGRWVHIMQQWLLEKTGYPFPLLYWLKLFGSRAPPPLEIQIADPIDCEKCSTTAKVKFIFRETVEQLNKNGIDRPIEWIE